ncbi:MAG: NAD(P)-binding protein, partial [Jiangellales bacterium]
MPVPTIAVIGAGAAGLTAMKALLDEGVIVTAFEKGDRVGGLWVKDNSSGLSPAYESLRLITSKGRTQFADYPMPTEWEDYPATTKVASYLTAYAHEFRSHRPHPLQHDRRAGREGRRRRDRLRAVGGRVDRRHRSRDGAPR